MKTQIEITSIDRLNVIQTGYDGGCGEDFETPPKVFV